MRRTGRLPMYRVSLIVSLLVVLVCSSGAPNLRIDAHDNGNGIFQSIVFVQQ